MIRVNIALFPHIAKMLSTYVITKSPFLLVNSPTFVHVPMDVDDSYMIHKGDLRMWMTDK